MDATKENAVNQNDSKDDQNPNVAGNDDYASHVDDEAGQNSPQVEASQTSDTVLPGEPLYDETMKASETDSDEVPDEPNFEEHETGEFGPDEDVEPDFDADETEEGQA